jgi:predicted ATPase
LTVELPATIQAMLAARIDRLGPEAKRLLQAAAVVGKDVPYALLEAIADLDTNQLRQRLSELQAAEFLYETRLFPNLEYTFKHALTHEAAYVGVLRERRRSLHTRIMKAIERIYADRLAEHVERLGHHAFHAELWDEAWTYLRQAGDNAFARSANREAAATYEHALVAVAHLPETRDHLQHAFDLRLRLVNLYEALAEPRRSLDHALEAQPLAERLHDPLQRGWGLCLM